MQLCFASSSCCRKDLACKLEPTSSMGCGVCYIAASLHLFVSHYCFKSWKPSGLIPGPSSRESWVDLTC